MAIITDRNNNPMSMPDLAIARGDFPGVTHINKFGRNTAIASGATEDIWDGNTAYTYPTDATDITHVRAAVDSATTQGVTIEIQGLDANWNLVTQTKATDASNSTTEVALDTALRRVFRMKVLDAAVMDQNIWVGDDDFVVAAAKAIITAGNNQTLMAQYTVPANHTAYLVDMYASENPVTGNSATSIDIKLWARDNANGYAPQLKHVHGLAPATYFHQDFHPAKVFGEKTDIYITATTVGGTTDVSAGFDLILVDETVQ
jgi:hypothetical protein